MSALLTAASLTRRTVKMVLLCLSRDMLTLGSMLLANPASRAVRWFSKRSLKRSPPHWQRGHAPSATFQYNTLRSSGTSTSASLRCRRLRSWLQQSQSIKEMTPKWSSQRSHPAAQQCLQTMAAVVVAASFISKAQAAPDRSG